MQEKNSYFNFILIFFILNMLEKINITKEGKLMDKYCIYSSNPSMILDEGLCAAPEKPTETVAAPFIT